VQALRVKLHDCYNTLLAGEVTGDEALAALQTRALELEQDISRLELEAAQMDASSDPFAVPMAVEQVGDVLKPGGTLVSYYVAGDDIYAWVISRSRARLKAQPDDAALRSSPPQEAPPQVHMVRVGSTLAVARLLHRLALQLGRFEQGEKFVTQHRTQLERGTQDTLSGLYQLLIQPIEALLGLNTDEPHGLESPLDLTVIPHGIVHRVPFQALFDGHAYLVERAQITYAPSATAWALCQARGATRGGRSLAIGVADDDIPHARTEALAVATALSQPTVLIDAHATRERFLHAAPGCGVIHIACHGLFREDNPMFSSLKLADGWLTASDIAQLDLRTSHVVLSACDSGRMAVTRGDEALGLTRAFLSAGARTLLVSMWLAHDQSTLELMTHYYGARASGQQSASALRTAQLALKRVKPHPFYWAAFMLVGS